MSYNSSAIMKAAWSYARAEISASRFPMDRAAAMQSLGVPNCVMPSRP